VQRLGAYSSFVDSSERSVKALNNLGSTALHVAIWGQGRTSIVRLLIEAGICVDAQNSYGETPLYIAA